MIPNSVFKVQGILIENLELVLKTEICHLRSLALAFGNLYLNFQAPHPPYRPSNDLVTCRDPLCASLHSPGDYRCDNPRQCDYEVEYADGGSSLGVLVRDGFSLKFTNGMKLAPRLALG